MCTYLSFRVSVFSDYSYLLHTYRKCMVFSFNSVNYAQDKDLKTFICKGR